MLPTLMWWALERRRRRRRAAGAAASDAARRSSPGSRNQSMRNSSSRCLRPASSKIAFISLERVRLEQVLEVGVPDPDAREADLRGLRAAVAPAEQAPLAADVHLDRAGHGPVEAHQLDVAHRSLLLLAVEPAPRAAAPGAPGLNLTRRRGCLACARRASCRSACTATSRRRSRRPRASRSR